MGGTAAEPTEDVKKKWKPWYFYGSNKERLS